MKGEIEHILTRTNAQEFKVFIYDGLPCSKPPFAPTVDDRNLKEVNKVMELIDTFGEEAKKFQAVNESNPAIFLLSVINYLRSLNEIIMRSKLSEDTSTLIDIDAMEILLKLLEFDVGDSNCSVENWRASRVATKRYANMRPKFLKEVLVELQVCLGRQKTLMKGGLLYKAVAEQDLASVVHTFTPSLAAVPSRQMPSPIFCALETGNLVILDYLAERCEITSQADPNYSNYTILHYAARCDVAVLETLLENVPKNKLEEIINSRDIKNRTPLHVAANCHNYAAVEILCKHGSCYNLLIMKNETPAFMCRNDKKLTDFFKVLEEVLRLARQGEAQEVSSICKGSTHNGRALLNAKDGTGMSAQKILVEKMQRKK